MRFSPCLATKVYMFGLKSCLLGNQVETLYSLKVPFVVNMITFDFIKSLDTQLIACITKHGKI
jgi:hypothetical protein